MQSAITICLVPEARQGPFVFHGDHAGGLEAGCREAAELGFDAVEVFPESAAAFPEAATSRLDGLRLDWPGGWLLVRASNTEPIVRIVAEAADNAAVYFAYLTRVSCRSA